MKIWNDSNGGPIHELCFCRPPSLLSSPFSPRRCSSITYINAPKPQPQKVCSLKSLGEDASVKQEWEEEEVGDTSEHFLEKLLFERPPPIRKQARC